MLLLLALLLPSLVAAREVCAVGNATVIFALGPEAPPPPPPKDALAWVESGERPWVAVVDVGDGERWLQQLHSRSAVATVLWRVPPDKKWKRADSLLEVAPAYVWAAHETESLLRFQEAVPKKACFLMGRRANIPWKMQFNTRAPTLLALSDSVRGGSENFLTDKYTEIFNSTWHNNRGFFSLLLHEQPKQVTDRWNSSHTDSNGARPTKEQCNNESGGRCPLQEVKPRQCGDKTDELDQWRRLYFDPFDANGTIHRLPAHLSPKIVSKLLGKRFSDVNQYRIRIAWYPDSTKCDWRDAEVYGRRNGLGRDLRLLLEVVDSMNSDIDVDEIYSYFKGERPGIRVFFKLHMKEIDIATGKFEFTLNLDMKAVIDILPSTFDDVGSAVIVPKATPRPAWLRLFHALGPCVWTALAASALAYGLARAGFSGRSPCLGTTSAARNPEAWACVCVSPRHLRLVGAVLAPAAVFIAAAYQGSLLASTLAPKNHNQISSILDLIDLKIPVGVKRCCDAEELRKWVFSRPPGEDRLAAIRFFNSRLPGGFSYLTPPLYNRSTAYMVPLGMLDKMKYLYPKEWIKHTHLPDIKLPMLSFLMIHWNCPWRDTINTRILWLQAAGLYDYWDEEGSSDTARAWRDWDGIKSVEPTEMLPDTALPLSPSDMRIHLLVLAGGNALAILVFFVEFRSLIPWRRVPSLVFKGMKSIVIKGIWSPCKRVVVNLSHCFWSCLDDFRKPYMQ